MAKTCRTCGADWVYCEVPARDLSTVCRSGKGCGFWFRRETPLLVDEFAIAAKLLLEKMDNIGDGMLYNLDLLDAREILRKALVRHQKEVGDANV